MPGAIAIDSRPMQEAAARCRQACGGTPPLGPQQLLQLPYPAGELLGRNGLLGYVLLFSLGWLNTHDPSAQCAARGLVHHILQC